MSPTVAQHGTATPGSAGSAAHPPGSSAARVVPPTDRPMRVVVLVSGEGTNLQALLDAGADLVVDDLAVFSEVSR